MRFQLLFLCFLLSSTLSAQQFIEDILNDPIDGMRNSSVSFADLEQDGDMDMLLSGNPGPARATRLYLNEDGIFNLVDNTPFEGVSGGNVAFSDIDNDGDQDILIMGDNSAFEAVTKLYVNNNGTFSEVSGTPFETLGSGSTFEFADIDDDGDNDLLMIGENSSDQLIAKLYTNNGGDFTEVTGTSFVAVDNATIDFADIDGDDDLDVLITGFNGEFIANLYLNNDGTFTQDNAVPFAGSTHSAVDFADIDGDDDLDVLIMTGAGFTPDAKLYQNNNGVFTEISNVPFKDLRSSSVAFADVDLDDDQDVILTGSNSSGERESILYINLGSIFFPSPIEFQGVSTGFGEFADFDGDGDLDLIISGEGDNFVFYTKLYINQELTPSNTESSNILNFDFNLYPNPLTSNQLQISSYTPLDNSIAVDIFDVQGRHLLHHKEEFGSSGEHNFTIDISSLQKGSYFIQLSSGKQKGSKIFIKE